jgi:hypothetical protein
VPALRVKWGKKFGNILLTSGRSEEREAHSIAVPTSADDQIRELADSSKEGVLANALLDDRVHRDEHVQLKSTALNSYNWVSRSMLATQALYRIYVSRRYTKKGVGTRNKPMLNKMQTINF